MLTRSVFFTVTLLLCIQLSMSFPPEKGILIRPIKTDGRFVGELGAVVTYSYVDPRKHSVLLRLSDTSMTIPAYHIIPYDSVFSASRIYLFLTSDEWQSWDGGVVKRTKFRYLLAKNTCSEFPRHPLYEDLLALSCQYAADYELEFTEGYQTPAISIGIAKDYLEKFPYGRFKDEIEWRLIRLEHRVFEYEGYAAGPSRDVRLYEDFLRKRPKSLVADQINLHIAYLCRVITESLEDDLEMNAPDGFVREDIERFRQKALGIYRQLLASEDITARETARVAIYNIEHGRTALVGGTDW